MVKPAAQKPAEKRAQGGTELDELKAQLAQMQAKLEKLAEPDK
jgi:polyhydroxyalkanoate synthesis regulator protein